MQPGLRLHLRANRPLPGLSGTYDLVEGDRLDLVLTWGRFQRHHAFDADARLRMTVDAWGRWIALQLRRARRGDGPAGRDHPQAGRPLGERLAGRRADGVPAGAGRGVDRMEVAVHFRPVPHLPAGFGGEPPPNVLRFQLEPEGVVVGLTGVGAQARTLAPLTLTAGLAPAQLPAYGRLLLDVFQRNAGPLDPR